MSSDSETINMTNERTLTPELRFPEFRDGEGWQTLQLSDLYAFKRSNTLSRNKLNYDSGTIRNIHYGDIHTKFQPLFRVNHEYVPFINPEVSVNVFKDKDDCEVGDIVLADASEDVNDVGKAIEVVSLDGQRVVAGTHTILATRHGSVPVVGFGGHLFQSAVVRAGIQRESQGAKVYGISANRISPVALPLPPTNQEQQKIAECLSSLDGLIAAEGQKLTALRHHKRGLMQQLFPQPGQTEPHLRFPAFQGAPGWDAKSVEQVCKILNNRRVPITSGDRTAGLYPYYGASGIVDYVDDFIFDERLVLVGEDGAKWKAFEPTAFIAEGKYWVNNHAHVLKPTGLIDTLLANYLTLLDVGGYVTGAAPPKLTLQKLKTIPIPVPPSDEEQQLIADCLTALDTRITAQAKNIDALKQHKRGLMQHLFPAPEVS